MKFFIDTAKVEDIKKANDLTTLLAEFGVNNIIELKQMLNLSQDKDFKIEITQEI